MSFDELSSEMTKSRTSGRDSSKNEKKKRSILTSIFSKKGKNKRGGCDAEIVPEAEILFDLDSSYLPRKNFLETSSSLRKSLSARRYTSTRIESLNLSILDRQRTKRAPQQVQDYKIYVGTWNLGGRSPNNSLNLEDFLQVEGSSDIYVLGFQEIVPLNAGNVLVIEDNEPAAKWLALIGQALNKPRDIDDFAMDNDPNCRYSKSPGGSGGGGGSFFQRPSLKVLSKNYRANTPFVKTCNCRPELDGFRLRARKLSDLFDDLDDDDLYGFESSNLVSPEADRGGGGGDSYCLIARKQMVGIFLSVWVRSELVQHIGHVRLATVGRGIMGRLGNKGCIALSMSVHRTSFSFVCSHLTSGQREGNELKRNADVAEILRTTQFPRSCKDPGNRVPEKIIDHDRIVWFGDLNYRIALSYEEAVTLIEDNDWGTLLGRDQLVLEREAGRVFYGWKEGKICFAPTYKYTQNSDAYAGETMKSKKKRRTPSWCDRILWYGNGIQQLQYVRGESQFSDHRPVCAVFKVQVEVPSPNTTSIIGRCYRKGFSNLSSKVPVVDVLPKRHSFYEY